MSKRHPVNVNLEYLSRRDSRDTPRDFTSATRSRRFVRAPAYISRMVYAPDSLRDISKFYGSSSIVLDTHQSTIDVRGDLGVQPEK